MQIPNSKKSDNSKTLSEKEAIRALTALCSKKELCVSEIARKIRIWEFDNSTSLKIIEFLLKNNFVNEQRYANAFVNDKFKFNKWGKYKIENSLKAKFIPETIIDNALQLIPKEDSNKQIFDQLFKKLKSIKSTDKYQIRSKLYRFGISRGFDPDAIQISIDKIVEKSE